MNRNICFSLLLYMGGAHSGQLPFEAPDMTTSQMDFGGVGLIQMPTARMAPDGEFNFNATFNDEYQFYSVSLQVMPWLETTIRYTMVNDLLYSDNPDFSGSTKYTDKGIDFKFRLLEESQWIPETSIGIRDFAGTGLFDGEFIAMSKQYSSLQYGQFDFTLGMGWGYMGQRGNVTNPFCKVSDRYCERPPDFKNNGGSVDFERWFKGPAALYGGVEYQTLHDPLSLKLEYDGNDYSQDFPVVQGGINMTPQTPWNIGLVYRLGQTADFRLSYERGTTVTAGISLHTNYNDLPSFWVDEPIPRPTENDKPSSINTVDWHRVNMELNEIAGYEQNEIYTDDGTIIIVSEQKKYRDRNEALHRAAAVLANHTPEYIKTYKVIERSQGLTIKENSIDAKKYQDIAHVRYIEPKINDAITEDKAGDLSNSFLVFNGAERFDYGISPHLVQSLGSAEDFYLYSLGATGDASYWINNNLKLTGSVYLNIADNYDKFNYTVPELGQGYYVPRVRSLVRSYISENTAYMNNLQLTWFEQHTDNLYQQVYGGYLETMFAGVGSEILYRPKGANWAVGADLTMITQRDPSSWFGTFDDEWQSHDNQMYRVIDQGYTGHLSGYYMPEWEALSNLLIRVDVGQFLAGDKGTQVDISKQFKSGVIAGAYAAITDLSSDEYGEGSFTKGFYISIPFDVLTVKPSNNRASLSWQPLTRDGGQKLGKHFGLFDLTDTASPWYQRANTSGL